MAIPPEAYEDFLQNEVDGADELDDYEIGSVLTQVLRYACGRLGSATLFYPFELTRILRQVQHLPLDEPEKPEELYEFGQNAELKADSQGYLLAGRWPLRLRRESGLWGSSLEIARRQGLFSLWRGMAAHGAMDLAQSLGQAALEEVCYAMWPNADSQWVAVASAAAIAVVTQPLDRARTLLACQSVWPGEQRFTSLWSTLTTSKSYGHRWFDWLSYLASAALRIIPLAWTSQRVEGWYQQGLTWTVLAMLAEQASYSLPLLLSVPLETIRRRLQAQSDPLMVQRIRMVDNYTGPWDCFRRVIRQEGWSQLYQGLGWQMMQNSSLLLVHTLGNRIDEADLQNISDF